jgi:hypothetical protein
MPPSRRYPYNKSEQETLGANGEERIGGAARVVLNDIGYLALSKGLAEREGIIQNRDRDIVIQPDDDYPDGLPYWAKEVVGVASL